MGTVATETHTLIETPAESFGSEPITAVQLTVLPHDPVKSIHSPEWGFVVDDLEAWVVSEDGSKSPICFRASVPDVPWLPTDPIGTIGPNGENWGADSRIHYARSLILVPEQPIEVKEGERLGLHIHCNQMGMSHPMAIQRGHLSTSSDARWGQWAAMGSEVNSWNQQLAQALKRYSEIPGTTVPIMLNRPQ